MTATDRGFGSRAWPRRLASSRQAVQNGCEEGIKPPRSPWNFDHPCRSDETTCRALEVTMATPMDVLDRLHDAMNRHDVKAFVACVDPDYASEQPAHPDRGFGGREQVEKNWAELF